MACISIYRVHKNCLQTSKIAFQSLFSHSCVKRSVHLSGEMSQKDPSVSSFRWVFSHVKYLGGKWVSVKCATIQKDDFAQ